MITIQTSKLLKDWVIPPSFLSLNHKRLLKQATRLTTHESTTLSRNTKFHNLYTGKRCFIIGNGPSLNTQDLTPLADEITFTMNQFNKHPILEKWKPTFFCMADPRYIQKPEILPDFLTNIEAQTYFFLIDAKKIFDENKLLDLDRIYYLKTTGKLLHEWTIDKYNLDLTKTILGAQTTAHMAIMIALYMKCSPIYLLGLDHDWLAHSIPERHFYESSPQAVSSSVYPDYKAWLQYVLKTWKVYESLQRIADKQSVTIYNATAGGFLDIFPRTVFEELFPSIDKESL